MEKFWWLNEESQGMLESGYLLPNQTVQEKLEKICKHNANVGGTPEKWEKFYDVFAYGWASLSSPIWANHGEDRGLPISCFGTYVSDDLYEIYRGLTEVAMETKAGGGTSGYFNLRPKGSAVNGGAVTSGLMSFLKDYDTTVTNVAQNGVRRGAFAAYIDADHDEYYDFISIKDKKSPIQKLNTGVSFSKSFMDRVKARDPEALKRVLAFHVSRSEKGFPYAFFDENVNNNKPQVYKDKGIEIKHSNLCSEIALESNSEESFVCCLLSMNLYLYDEWKDTDSIELMIEFLDNVITDFVQKGKDIKGLERAVKFAENQRALGLGVLGYHSYLQKKRIPFDSLQAGFENQLIFKDISAKAEKATIELAKQKGEAPILKGYGRRNVTLMAIAPTTSSSSILGQMSMGIEPYVSNLYTFEGAKGSFTRFNRELKMLLESKGMLNDDVIDSVASKGGSVKHLDFLTDDEKAVFATAWEINPETIIRQAAQRQKFIDQSQSLNLFIPIGVEVKEMHRLFMLAYELGVKTLYYQRGQSLAKEELLAMMECKSCES